MLVRLFSVVDEGKFRKTSLGKKRELNMAV